MMMMDIQIQIVSLLFMTMMIPSFLLPSTHIFQSLPSFLLYQPTTSVSEHFQSGPGRNLSIKPQDFFADELCKSGVGARHLVAQAFGNKAHLLTDKELPSTSETYVHLLIALFMLTLSLSQKDAFSNILSILIPDAILQGHTGTSQIFSSGSTRIPSSREDVKNFYTEHTTSILSNIPSPVTNTPRQDGNIYSFSSYYDCTQHFLAWGPPLTNFALEISP
jgi:hypothetical protein